MKIGWIVAIVSILAGAGSYKFGPALWHKAQDKFGSKTKAAVKAGANSNTTASGKTGTPVISESNVSTNADGVKVFGCDLGTVSLTNHYETCVSLGKGKDCILTPKLIDDKNVELTVAVESKNAKGKIHDLSVTEVSGRLGKPLQVAIGGFSFSLTPNMNSE